MSSVPVTPFDTAGSVLEMAIAISNDASSQFGLQGQILNANQPYTFTLMKKVYRDLQDKLITSGVETFTDYVEIKNIVPAATSIIQPRTLLQITPFGYWNGATTYSAVHLPPNLILPLELWESQSGGNTWVPMKQASDSISTRPPQPRFGIWDWTGPSKLIIPQATQQNDIRLKALVYAPDITDQNSIIYVPHAQTALANLLIAAAAKMAGGLEMAQVFDKDAKEAINLISNRTAIKEEYGSYVRRPFRNHRSGRSGRGGYSGG